MVTKTSSSTAPSYLGLLGLVALSWLATSGCSTACYIAQAAYGQDDIAWRARSIEEVIADPGTSERTRQLLSLVSDVKLFGEQHGLAPTSNYREYVELPRSSVVYVVSAAPPLELKSKTWWFPIVGSVPYLGFFNQHEAKGLGRDLVEQGWDVDLRGASAYSTLGWFDDPILSTMISPRDSVVGGLVNVVLHESVHATHYVGGQTYFDESLANFIADELTKPYLVDRLQLDRWQLLAYQESKLRGRRRAKRMHETYKTLEALYGSELSDEAKLRQKHVITEGLRAEIGFWRPINNATLAQSRQYHGGSPVFDGLFSHCGRDWRRFWSVVVTIERDDFAEDQQKDLEPLLAPLLAAACPA
jgi:predicted aminopeptidase